jgi:inositol phosphorylceramide mannosyltransferase catalytic subunit
MSLKKIFPPIPLDDLVSPPSYQSRPPSLSSEPEILFDVNSSSYYIGMDDEEASQSEVISGRHAATNSISSPPSLLSCRRRLSTRTRILVILTTTLSVIILFRRHLVAMALILNCYITWPFWPPPSLSVDILSLPTQLDSPPAQSIPRNMHHVLLGPLALNPPEDWVAARESCLEMHSSWEHYFWTDDNANAFFEEYYPWFLDTWNAYPSIVQRADAMRYFVLHQFGGVFLDMDLFCRNQLDPLILHLEAMTSAQYRRPAQGNIYFLGESDHPHMLLAPKANPVGVSNGFIISSKGHPLLSQMVTFLPRFNLNFVSSYATVMFSTGCMYISSHMQLFARRRWGRGTVLVLDGTENMLNGNVDTPLFRHLGTSSWHSSDAKFMRSVIVSVRKAPVGTGWFVLAIIVLVAVLVARRRGVRTVQGGVRRLLRRVSHNDHETG